MSTSFDIDYNKLPAHIAVIMDGNGRWASGKGLPKIAGHKAGMEALKKIVRKSGEIGLKHLTVYAFSTENWKRSDEEVSGIFQILVYYMEREIKEIHAQNVKVQILGDYSIIPEKARQAVERAVNLTKNNTGLSFNIALNYGGRDEIKRKSFLLCWAWVINNNLVIKYNGGLGLWKLLNIKINQYSKHI